MPEPNSMQMQFSLSGRKMSQQDVHQDQELELSAKYHIAGRHLFKRIHAHTSSGSRLTKSACMGLIGSHVVSALSV